MSCWIALDDVNEDNGGLYFVPGSHEWGLLSITGLTGELDSVNCVLNKKQKQP